MSRRQYRGNINCVGRRVHEANEAGAFHIFQRMLADEEEKIEKRRATLKAREPSPPRKFSWEAA